MGNLSYLQPHRGGFISCEQVLANEYGITLFNCLKQCTIISAHCIQKPTAEEDRIQDY